MHVIKQSPVADPGAVQNIQFEYVLTETLTGRKMLPSVIIEIETIKKMKIKVNHKSISYLQQRLQSESHFLKELH